MSLRKLASRPALYFAATMSLCATLLVGASASAAGLTQVTAAWNGGTTEPSYITMYEYIPTKVATNPPILVVVHYCGGNASGIYGEAQGGGIISAADSEGFIMIFPQLASSRNCWDVATTASLTHATGTASGGDTKAIVDMVNYEIKTRNANANRVYSIGSSSGAMMTEALLAVYPDVFKGGAEFSGVPAGCWSDQYASSNQWSGPCAGGQNTMTAAAWGTLVKGMYPGYSGFRPRIQLWHGSADTTISPTNQTEAIKEWTNVMGLPTNPDTTTSVTISSHTYSRQQWKDPTCSGVIQLDAWTESNGPHGTDANMNGQYSLPFMNLDSGSTPFAATDPQAACGTSSTGTGGSPATGGTTGTGGGGAAGAKGTGGTGTTGTGGSGTTGTGGSGTTGTGGTGTTGTGGSGTTGTGGTGTTGTGGSIVTGTGGSATTGTGGVNGTGGNGSSTGGATGTGTGGSDTTGTGGDTGSGAGGTVGVVNTAPAGCACDVANTSGAMNVLALLAGLFVLAFSRRRTKRSPNA